MNIRLMKASVKHTFCMENLMQFYMYDFSVYTGMDVQCHGLFEAYNNLQSYWLENGKFAYLVMQEEKYIGFVLVKQYRAANIDRFSITEFFILKRYRRQSIGSYVSSQVFDMHRGCWHVSQLNNNKAAQQFWRKVIAGYTCGKFNEHFTGYRVVQEFNNG